MRARTWLYILLIACLLGPLGRAGARQASAPAGTLDEKQGCTLPFDYDPLTRPFIVVQANLGDGKPRSLALDTGLSGPMVLDQRVAEELKLKPTGGTVQVSPGALAESGLSASLVTVPEVVLAQGDQRLQIRGVPAAVADLAILRSAGASVDGILGAPVLAAMTCRLDFDTRRITFWGQPHPPLNIPGATAVPVREEENRYLVPVSAGDDSSRSRELLLDTGSEVTTLPPELASGLSPRISSSALHSTVTTVYLGEQVLLPALRVGSLREPSVQASISPSSEEPRLGLNVLSRFRVTLDLRNKQVLLERLPDAEKRRRVDGTLGLHLAKEGSDYRVAAVDPGSEGERAGLREGDLLTEIGGEPLSELTQLGVQALLNGHAGTEVRLTLKRGDDPPFTKTLKRESVFARPLSPLTGLLLLRQSGRPLSVLEVTPGSPAERSGLRAKDELLELNGVRPEVLSLEDLVSHLKRPELTLSLRRPGQEAPVRLKLKTPPR